MMDIKVIKNETEYEAALARAEALMDAAPGTPESDELELLAVLIEDYEAQAYPINLPDPVEAIKFRMDQQGLTGKDMRQYLGSASKVSEVLSGKRPLSLTMIRRLHKGLGIPAEVLLQEPGSVKVDDCAYDVDAYPLREMVERGYFGQRISSLREARLHGEELLSELFAVFQGTQQPQPVYCKRSDAPINEQALLAWQARVLQLIAAARLPLFSHQSLTPAWTAGLVRLSYLDTGPTLVREYLGKKGIHFAVLAHLPKTRLDGASFLTPEGQPVVALTLRQDRLDNFWFTVAHELGHVLLHLVGCLEQNRAFFDETTRSRDDDSKEEREANAFATELLIPATRWQETRNSLTGASAIQTFADELGISAAIVAGRAQWESNDYRRHAQLLGRGMVRRQFAQR
ncbi:MAG: ImmA/IrrE family metallo-endopeptidase [Anaerolineales bacterium]|nr:ImmA/IrrE family metallo-endopeptidase [Anaerolineales bacterium]